MTASSFGTAGYSPLCHGVIMWMTELATKTTTAESRMGSQSAARLIMGTSRRMVKGRGGRGPVPRIQMAR